MHQRTADLQEQPPGAPEPGRVAAAAAALILLGAGVAGADPDPPRPALARHGWLLDLTGYVQTDAVVYSQESLDELSPAGDVLDTERFLIPRARLRAEAHKDALLGALELDGNTLNGTPAARLLGAQVGWAYRRGRDELPLVALTAGLFKTPFGTEIPSPEREKAFLEPPAWARAIVPLNYDGGAMASGAYGIARWSLGVMNGAPVGDAQWKGRDPSASHDFMGRVGAAIDAPRNWRIEAGVSALSGTGLHPGTPPTKDTIQWVDENQDGLVQTTELQVVPGQAGTPSQRFDRDALGADVQVHWCLCRLGNGTAFAEGVLATNLDRGLIYADPIAASRDFREVGFSIGAVQQVGAHAAAGVRYDWYDGDRDVTARLGEAIVGQHQELSTLSLMVSGYWHDARLMAQYDHNKNPYGRDDAGTPVTREADRLTVRAQVGF